MASVDLSFSKKYNNVDWNISIFITKTDISLTTPGSSNQEEKKSIIETKNILIINFKNSLINPVPTIMIEFIDNYSALTNYIRSQNCNLHIQMSRPLNPEATSIKKQMFIDCIFLMKDVQMVSFNKDSITYRLYGELNNSIPLNTICNYATIVGNSKIKEELENPYKIAYSILASAGYPLFPIQVNSIDEKGNNVLGPSMYMYPNTNIQTNFITNQNLTVFDAINYLFALGGMKDNEPVYLIHKLCENKGFIASRKTLMSPKMKEKDANITKFDFKMTSIQFMSINIMQFVELESRNGGIDFSKLFFNYEFFEYDHNERKWYTDEVSKAKLNNILTTNKNENEESLLGLNIESENKDFALKYQYPPINGTLITDVKKNLDLFTSLISFTVNGNIELDVGSIINIKEDGDDKVEQFNGRWMIIEVQHSFIDKVFKTHLKCCRVTYIKSNPITNDI